ncbi:MAG: hypothetical protein FRX49_00369 [Trebouxia sp. A1-2]|nr:MAG: hypothetical protein FRX49_13691 [Trebouxia sp. A1-2]KAA6429937.1 MAG: hypothetical protein FRX49_00369 [Trebouxia sp. A1-2]
MPGLPAFSVQGLSVEQIEQYAQSASADKAARDIAKSLGLEDYQHDAATAVCVDYEASIFLPKQIAQIAQFFGQGLFAHHKLYNFLLTQPQAYTEHKVSLQVETAKVQPLKGALSEEQWRQYNADLAAEAEAGKQAEEAAEQGRQLAQAQAAEQQAAEEAEAERQSKLTKPVQTLEEAVEQAVAQRVEAERKVLESEYHQREVALLDTVAKLEASLAAAPPAKKK